ncbi:MAG: alpha/beta hydrolase [Candidatus Omnitrophica bacterium]|nr:alpha/beta hydrolase [Candidatus Omnitrophota bacterium]
MILEDKTLHTKDGQSIVFDCHQDGNNQIVILAHGFYNNKDACLLKNITLEFAKYYDVITFDFRGHGKSSGSFSWTSDEPNDLAAVLDYAKEQNYEKIGVIGFSLGAAATLVEASHNKLINSVIAVSAPFDFWQINFHFWEPEMLNDLKLNLGMKGKGKFIRPGNPLAKKIKPIDIVEFISPAPIFFIHGANDWIIKTEHSQKLFEKAKEPKKLLMIDDVGHAEKIFDDKPNEFISECRQWFDKTLAKESKQC